MKLLTYIFFILIISCGKDTVQSTISSGNDQAANPTSTESENGQALNLVLNDTIIIDYQKVYYHSENNLTLSFEKVVEESRCPQGVECFWEGDAIIQFNLAIDEVKHQFKLHTLKQNQTYYENDGLKIELLNVLPYPIIDKPVPVEDYKVMILITR